LYNQEGNNSLFYREYNAMPELCACSVRMLDTNDANYVINGVPCCSRECFIMRRDSYPFICHRTMGQVMDLERREQATRIIGSFEDGFRVVG
jgi:hypothetical protein